MNFQKSIVAPAGLVLSLMGAAMAALPAPATAQATLGPRSAAAPLSIGTIGNGTGLHGEYFDNQDLSGLRFTRLDPTVDFDWNSSSPSSSIGPSTFSVRWTGRVQAQHSETYTFHTTTDDGVRLWVNGEPLISRWTQGVWESSGTISLVAGVRYTITMEYFEWVGNAHAHLRWSSQSTPDQVIPTTQLYPPLEVIDPCPPDIDSMFELSQVPAPDPLPGPVPDPIYCPHVARAL